jgi:phosphomannomutase
MRCDSPAFAQALSEGFLDSGVSVIPIGLCGTEEVYFNTDHQNADLGLMVTASHNPEDYSGIKLILKHAHAITRENGLGALEEAVYGKSEFHPVETFGERGSLHPQLSKKPYIERLLEQVRGVKLKPLRIVSHAGNGCAGPIIDLIEDALPIEWIRIDHQPDAALPNGVPNPLLPEKRARARAAVIEHHADLGLAWDGDFDRCFFYDHRGHFVEGYYLVGLIAQTMLRIEPGGTILYDPRLTWNTEDLVGSAGGRAVMCRTGHAYFKQAMRRENAIYGGEMSAHHYFRDFCCCDTGMLPWLTVVAELSQTGRTLADLVDERIAAFPCSGEINFKVSDTATAIERVADAFSGENPRIEELDGVSMTFDNWRFNLRSSNTESLLRLNVESRGRPELMVAMTRRISEFLAR